MEKLEKNVIDNSSEWKMLKLYWSNMLFFCFIENRVQISYVVSNRIVECKIVNLKVVWHWRSSIVPAPHRCWSSWNTVIRRAFHSLNCITCTKSSCRPNWWNLSRRSSAKRCYIRWNWITKISNLASRKSSFDRANSLNSIASWNRIRKISRQSWPMWRSGWCVHDGLNLHSVQYASSSVCIIN